MVYIEVEKIANGYLVKASPDDEEQARYIAATQNEVASVVKTIIRGAFDVEAQTEDLQDLTASDEES